MEEEHWYWIELHVEQLEPHLRPQLPASPDGSHLENIAVPSQQLRFGHRIAVSKTNDSLFRYRQFGVSAKSVNTSNMPE